MQATVCAADVIVAWVIGVQFQGRGYATEAAAAMIDWLRRSFGPGNQGEGAGSFARAQADVNTFVARIAPAHVASQHVARKLGFQPRGRIVDGEEEWRRA